MALLALIPPILGLIALGFLSDYSIKVSMLGTALGIAIPGAALAVARVEARTASGTSTPSTGYRCGSGVGSQALLGLALAAFVAVAGVRATAGRATSGRPSLCPASAPGIRLGLTQSNVAP